MEARKRAVGLRSLCWLGLAGLWWALAAPAADNAPAAGDIERGRRIYQEGILSSGEPMTGMRFGGIDVEGEQVACINCHRRSGMGSVEGDIQIPPITGNYLFDPQKYRVATMDPRRGKLFSQAHPPYTDAQLAAALRDGVNNRGIAMNDMMPRYALGEADLKALTAYLKQLSTQWSPGVTNDKIVFATVIAPDVTAARRKAFLDTLNLLIAQKNASTVAGGAIGRAGRRHMVTAAEMVLGTERKWELLTWELQGAPETWAAQLQEKYRQQPVFALLSGLSESTWAPVHAFCQQQAVPCWFPSVALPVADESFYSIYFSRGVLLEAAVLARHLGQVPRSPKQRLVQIHRDEPVARAAAEALSAALADARIKREDRVVGDSDGLRRALQGLGPDDVAMLWLRPADLAGLQKLKPPAAAVTYASAELAGGERGPFPATWKDRLHLIYPYELPAKRQGNLAYFQSWLKITGLPLVDEPLQSEVFFAVDFLTDTLAEMLDNVHRDYLIERAENMLSRREAAKSEQQVRERLMWSRSGHAADRQESTAIYPRMGLGVGQRFASKGGYIVRFDKNEELTAASDWIVP